ncbi:MAG: histidine phosphatase family protein [Flammeovirgaceae bacterium]
MSSSKDFYIIRHGETEYNRLGLVQGCGVDADLNELGRLQAHAFYQMFSSIGFDKIYTSKLKRTHQSVYDFIKDGIPWEQLEGLNEISWGNKEGRIITAEDDRAYHEMLSAWRRGELNWKVAGGESPNEVKIRQLKAWSYILSNTHENNILICMHGRAMRILLCYLLNVDMSQMDKFQHQNLGLYHLRLENGKYTLLKENYTEHLKNLYKKELELLNH